MNQKGEATLFGILILITLSGLLTLCALELQKSFKQLQARTSLFLCVKETKGELNDYLRFMGRTNWALRNISKAQLIAIFIPGLQGAALEADKAKRVLKKIQSLRLVSYLNELSELRNKGCPLDPRMLLTPYQLSGQGYQRGADDVAILRREKWTYLFYRKPYLLQLSVNASAQEKLKPKIDYLVGEKGVTSLSLLSSR